MAFKFEQLKIWHLALELDGEISDLVKSFHKEELFILTSQTKRAADSGLLNITEGSILQSKKKFSCFLIIANRSALEVIACLYPAKRRTLIDEQQFLNLNAHYEK